MLNEYRLFHVEQEIGNLEGFNDDIENDFKDNLNQGNNFCILEPGSGYKFFKTTKEVEEYLKGDLSDVWVMNGNLKIEKNKIKIMGEL